MDGLGLTRPILPPLRHRAGAFVGKDIVGSANLAPSAHPARRAGLIHYRSFES